MKKAELKIEHFTDSSGETVEFTHSSGNVFADLGLPDAEELFYKSTLIYRIAEIIRQRQLSQTAAAQLVGLKQPDLSNLLRGRMEGFSVERLFTILNKLGYQVELRITPVEEVAYPAQTLVVDTPKFEHKAAKKRVKV